MRILTIGDVHGRDSWKDVIGHEHEYDTIIFIGDYLDSFTHTPSECYLNLVEIVRWKDKFPDKIKLLVGNHDYQYFMLGRVQNQNALWCSGFKTECQWQIKQLYDENEYKFTLAYQHGNILWTHAGITQGFWDSQLARLYNDDWGIDEFLNTLYRQINGSLTHCSKYRGGWHAHGGPLWADWRELVNNPFGKLHQIVGHSHRPQITTALVGDSILINTDCMMKDGDVRFHILEL
jgi:predicted phosphodiesterase